MRKDSSDNLADGSPFKFWEKPQRFSRTYHVSASHRKADDKGPGSEDKPFLTINRAAQVLKPGERVLISQGEYREWVRPARGGSGPDKMISYEAVPGDKVVIKGSELVRTGWEPSRGWRISPGSKVWQLSLKNLDFGGYNPFGMVNVLHDRHWLDLKKLDPGPYFRRRGLVFVDGRPLKQVDLYRDLSKEAGCLWIEHDGRTLHVRLLGDSSPEDHELELVIREQAFAPEERFLGYIRLKGLAFEHAANGFPVPQRGLVSTNRGHHWIFEDCQMEWANSVALDIGKEDWHAPDPEICGHHVLRRLNIRQAGICGLAALSAKNILIEDCLFEEIGWQGAELMYESAGIKFHHAPNMLFRRNLVRKMNGGSGIWMDCGNRNCRITESAFLDIACINGAVHYEGTHDENLVDNNLISGVRCQPGPDKQTDWGGLGVYAQGTDRLRVENNLIMDCELAGFRGDTIPHRIIDSRGGTGRKNRVVNNIFHDCRRAAVEFANEHNFADGNLYSKMPGGYLRVETPDPSQRLDLATWREFHGWDRKGRRVEISPEIRGQSRGLSIKAPKEAGKIRKDWSFDPRKGAPLR